MLLPRVGPAPPASTIPDDAGSHVLPFMVGVAGLTTRMLSEDIDLSTLLSMVGAARSITPIPVSRVLNVFPEACPPPSSR